MSEPRRIQRSRRKGWRMPANTVYVGRPSEWGNRYSVGQTFDHVDGTTVTVSDRAHAVKLYREWLDYQQRHFHVIDQARTLLAGKNLCCFCPIDQPCHADVLLELANR